MDIVDPLFERAVWTYAFFLLFIMIGALSLMNLLLHSMSRVSFWVKKVAPSRRVVYGQDVCRLLCIS